MRVDLLEKLAIHNVLDETLGRYITLAYRHYSTTYHTPLHVAHKVVTEEEVLLIFLEDRLEELEKHNLDETVETVFKRVDQEILNAGSGEAKAETVSDDEWVSMMNIKLRQQKEAKDKLEAEKKAAEAVQEVDKVIDTFNKSMSDIKNKVSR